jgi:hypothetical protein
MRFVGQSIGSIFSNHTGRDRRHRTAKKISQTRLGRFGMDYSAKGVPLSKHPSRYKFYFIFK